MEFNEELQKLKEEFEKKLKQLENKYSSEIKCRKVSDIVLTKESFFSNKWNLKDEVDIPVGDETITFVVEHINKDGSAYFVTKDILCRSGHDGVNDYLDGLFKKFPVWLQEKAQYICHGEEHGTYQRKLSMLSSANVGGKYKENCTGVDDFQFDGFKTEASRCKNFDGNTCCWWLDTKFPGSSAYFVNVYFNGLPNYYSYVNNDFGVVCCFLI